MDELKAYLMPILKEIEADYTWAFKISELEYLIHYFHTLDHWPNRLEVLLCLMRAQSPRDGLCLIQGRKINAFYPTPTVLKTAMPDLLETPEIPSDAEPNQTFLEERMLSEEAVGRAHNLMANQTPLPHQVISMLEDQYWVENHFTRNPGYHHYQHSEGESLYLNTFGRSYLPGSFFSKGGFIGIYGKNWDAISRAPSSWVQYSRQTGIPLLCPWFCQSETTESVFGSFVNLLPYLGEERKIKPGDRLFLLGNSSDQTCEFSENQCQAVISNADSLGKNNPVIMVFNLSRQSLLSAFLSVLDQSLPGSGLNVELKIIPKPSKAWRLEDFWVRPLLNCYLLVVPGYQKHVFKPMVDRENCRCVEVGEVTEFGRFTISNSLEEKCVDIEWDFFAHFPIRSMDYQPDGWYLQKEGMAVDKSIDAQNFSSELEQRLTGLPYSDKTFILTQMERYASGLTARDVMVGAWQVPVAHIGVTASEYKDYRGEAMAIGVCQSSKTTPLLAAKIALNEVLVRLAASAISDFSEMCFMIFKPDWTEGMRQWLSMQLATFGVRLISRSDHWDFLFHQKKTPSNVFMVGFSSVIDVRKTLTPQWLMESETDLVGIVWEAESTHISWNFFKAIQTLNRDDLLLAYHDISDGGIALCLLEMAFCSHAGFVVDLHDLNPFKRYSGAVIQILRSNRLGVTDFLTREGLSDSIYLLGNQTNDDTIVFQQKGFELFSGSRTYLQRLWSQPGVEYQEKNFGGSSGREFYSALLDANDPGLHEVLTFDANQNITLPYISNEKPPIAILRFPGGVGHLEMAAAFDRVGFECIDVSMADILSGEEDFKSYVGLAIGGSGLRMNSSPLTESGMEDERVAEVLTHFFHRQETFALGTGQGCQWLTLAKKWMPHAEKWPSIQTNSSGHFECRWVRLKINKSPSLFLDGMENSLIPIPVSCEQGRLSFTELGVLDHLEKEQLIPLTYTNHYGHVTEDYPFNPTGSQMGIAGFTSRDGRVLGLMGHPERAVRSSQQTWRRGYLQGDAPWLRLFRNARKFID